jgi:hypothetical protein
MSGHYEQDLTFGDGYVLTMTVDWPNSDNEPHMWSLAGAKIAEWGRVNHWPHGRTITFGDPTWVEDR